LTLNFYQVGETVLIKALEESILGIKEGGKRRISVIPERGWRITDKAVSFLI
jgi:FKBP-type peptidyl-prolyl cis-trans isomerase 2